MRRGRKSTREILRRKAWIVNNGQSDNEFSEYKNTNEKLFADGDKAEKDLLSDIAQSVSTWAAGRDYYVR